MNNVQPREREHRHDWTPADSRQQSCSCGATCSRDARGELVSFEDPAWTNMRRSRP